MSLLAPPFLHSVLKLSQLNRCRSLRPEKHVYVYQYSVAKSQTTLVAHWYPHRSIILEEHNLMAQSSLRPDTGTGRGVWASKSWVPRWRSPLTQGIFTGGIYLNSSVLGCWRKVVVLTGFVCFLCPGELSGLFPCYFVINKKWNRDV